MAVDRRHFVENDDVAVRHMLHFHVAIAGTNERAAGEESAREARSIAAARDVSFAEFFAAVSAGVSVEVSSQSATMAMTRKQSWKHFVRSSLRPSLDFGPVLRNPVRAATVAPAANPHPCGRFRASPSKPLAARCRKRCLHPRSANRIRQRAPFLPSCSARLQTNRSRPTAQSQARPPSLLTCDRYQCRL